jgi:putative endonuclease
MDSAKHFCVYIVASKSRAIYIGVSSDLMLRMHQHRSRTTPSHTSRYRIDRLVWFEAADDAMIAIAREKQLKGWRREKKIRLIEAQNPTWEDLAAAWFAS